MFSTDPKDFDSAISELERQFSNRELIIPGEMFHMFGIRLFLSDLGVIKEGKETIVNQCGTYIVDLKESNRLPDIFHDKTEDIWMMNAYGRYQFTNATTAEFQAIKEFYSKAIFDAAMEGLPEHGKSLMELLKQERDRVLSSAVPKCLRAKSLSQRTDPRNHRTGTIYQYDFSAASRAAKDCI